MSDRRKSSNAASAGDSRYASNVMFAALLIVAAGIGIFAGAEIHHPSWSRKLTQKFPSLVSTFTVKRPPLLAKPVALAPSGPIGTWTDDPADLTNPNTAVNVSRLHKNGVSMILISGGFAGSRRAPTRHGVSDFVKMSGAVAGLNGTFFANASLEGTDNMMIGPSICGDETEVVIGPFDRRPALTRRPLVLLSPSRIKIVQYDPQTMDNAAGLRAQFPTLNDAFLGGVWLVHNAVAASPRRIASYHVKDANDYRRRAFFAVMMDGRPVLGATNCSVSSTMLAKALVAANVREAVLLDSGFSTSLVFQQDILVSGHSTADIPSRPVPQAVLLFGLPDHDSVTTASQNKINDADKT
jgi:hypothetical protein